MARSIKKYLVIFAILLIALFVLKKINWLPSFGNLFRSKPLTIDNTPILIKEINNLAQLITITAFDEVVMDSVKKSKRLPGTIFPPPPSRIVLIAKGKVMAGVDLKKIKNEDVIVKKDTLTMLLPKAEIISAIVNPSDFETFVETGAWSTDEVMQIKIRMREKIIQRALSQNLLYKAGQRCKLIIETFLRNTGAKHIQISFKDQSP